MSGGQWIDKASLICKEADTSGQTKLHHKFGFHYGFGGFFPGKSNDFYDWIHPAEMSQQESHQDYIYQGIPL